MASIHKIRLLAAAVIAPLIMPLMIYLTFLLIFGGDIEKDQAIKTSINTASWVSYGIALALGIASYFWMQRKGWNTIYRCMLAGIVLGFICWLLFSLISQTLVSLLFFIFAVAGLLMGISFWFIVYFRPDGSHTMPSSRRRRRRT